MKIFVGLNKDEPSKTDIIVLKNKTAKSVRSITELANLLFKYGLTEEEVEAELLKVDDILRGLAAYRLA